MTRTAYLIATLILTSAFAIGEAVGQQGKGSGSGSGSGSASTTGKGSGSGSGGHTMPIKGDTGASSKAFHDANIKMHEDMDITFSGDTDVDFVKGMVPHHQGAVDMAKVLLKYGKDPELRKLGEEIIAAQEKEIAFMNAWLKKKGK
jgi:hypothetical protein